MSQWNRRKKYYVAEEEIKEKVPRLKKTKFLKRELLLTMLTILTVTVAVIGQSYAIFSSIDKAENYNIVKTGTLQIAYDDTSTGLGNIISLNGTYPMSDVDGQATVPYKFKITNTGTMATTYKVKVLDDMDMITEDGCQDKLLGKDKIKYSINGGPPAILSTKAEEYSVVEGSLNASASVTYEIRMWIDEAAGNEVLGTHYHGKIVVEGVQGKETNEFSFTKDVQTYTVTNSGTYKIELWGAEGGAESGTSGKGGYTSGEIKLNAGEDLYIHVGEHPTYNTGGCYSSNPNNSYNGSTGGSCTGGGGATDVRLVSGEWNNETGLRSRIMVAGAGGGAHYGGQGGHAGGLVGSTGYGNNSSPEAVAGLGGTQTTGGAFGVSSNSTSISGNGYYSGKPGVAANAGGGSSYISGYPGCIAIKSALDHTPVVSSYSKIEDSYHYSGKIFENAVMKAGNVEMPTHDGKGTMIGNIGHGYAKITFLRP